MNERLITHGFCPCYARPPEHEYMATLGCADGRQIEGKTPVTEKRNKANIGVFIQNTKGSLTDLENTAHSCLHRQQVLTQLKNKGRIWTTLVQSSEKQRESDAVAGQETRSSPLHLSMTLASRITDMKVRRDTCPWLQESTS